MSNLADSTDALRRASEHLADIFEAMPGFKVDQSSKLLYDPSSIKRTRGLTTEGSLVDENTALLANIQTFPKLLAAGTDDHYENHHSYEIVQALSTHSTKMQSLEEEWKKLDAEDKNFHGANAENLAKAFQTYGAEHQGQGLPQSYIKAVEASSNINGADSSSSKTSINGFAANIAPLSATIPITMSALDGMTYSWATLLKSMNWARILYTIVWITTGLILLFFGYASFFWLHKVGLSRGNHSNVKTKGIGAKLSRMFSLNNEPQRSSIDSSASAAAKRRKAQKKRALVGGGIGGILIGFLFFSYLAAVITNAICIDDGKKALSAGAYFAVWLAPGILGAILAGHFAFLARAMTGVLGGTTFTIILTAVFGIKTMLVRMILLGVFTLSFTVPLIQPKSKIIQMMTLNACTSLIGMVTFLNGVALVAPSVEPSENWLDLWTVLCMRHSDSKDQSHLENAWHTSTFKGYIAGAVLGSVVGFFFELYFHRRCGHDPESEWNQYLGTYTQHMETGKMENSGSNATLYDDPKYNKAQIGGIISPRAGMFEPAPNAWQRMADFFDSDRSKPAHYGGLSGDGTLNDSFTAGAITSVGERIRRKRSTKTTRSGGPARFERLSKRDDDEDDFDSESSDDDEKERLNDEDDDDEKTDVEGSYDDKQKFASSGLVPTLDKNSNSTTMNYGGYALPRPPIMHNISNSSSGQIDSRLTGTTMTSGGSSSSSKGSDSKVHKPVNVYRDGTASPPSPSSNPTIPATPSLINAISRIQFAQQQARAWQQQHEAQGTPYTGANSPPPPTSPRHPNSSK